MSTSLRIVGITADGGVVAGDRYSTLGMAQKALDDLDFALFSQRDVGLSSSIIAYQIWFPDAQSALEDMALNVAGVRYD